MTKKAFSHSGSYYSEEDQEFGMEYLALLKIPSTKSAVLLDKLSAIFRDGEINWIILLRWDKFNVEWNVRIKEKEETSYLSP